MKNQYRAARRAPVFWRLFPDLDTPPPPWIWRRGSRAVDLAPGAWPPIAFIYRAAAASRKPLISLKSLYPVMVITGYSKVP